MWRSVWPPRKRRQIPEYTPPSIFRTTSNRIDALGASGNAALPYMPMITGMTTKGIKAKAAMMGAKKATFSSLQEAVR